MARFAQPDLLVTGSSSRAWDRYAYVENRPVAYVDPAGTVIEIPCTYCDKPLLDVSGWSGLGLALADAGCVVIGCHVDRAAGVIMGPSLAEHADIVASDIMGLANPIGMASSRLAPVGNRILQQAQSRGLGSALDLLGDVARRAERYIGGFGAVAGSQKHAHAAQLSSRVQTIFGTAGLEIASEVSYSSGRVALYGSPGSVRLDAVVRNALGEVIGVVDYKFGSATMSTSLVNQIRRVTRIGEDVAVIVLDRYGTATTMR